jgi:hypothetical protein
MNGVHDHLQGFMDVRNVIAGKTKGDDKEMCCSGCIVATVTFLSRDEAFSRATDEHRSCGPGNIPCCDAANYAFFFKSDVRRLPGTLCASIADGHGFEAQRSLVKQILGGAER